MDQSNQSPLFLPFLTRTYRVYECRSASRVKRCVPSVPRHIVHDRVCLPRMSFCGSATHSVCIGKRRTYDKAKRTPTCKAEDF